MRIRTWMYALIVVGMTARFGYSLPIMGQVVDNEARPVEGAEVAVCDRYHTPPGNPDGEPIVVVAKTDSAGRFEVDANVSSQRDTFVVARKNGFALAWDVLNAGANNRGKGLFLLVLEPPYPMTGQVVDPNGGPIAGASVQALPVTSYLERLGQRQITAPAEWFTVSTDAQGRFRFEQFGPDVSVQFRVRRPGRQAGVLIRPGDLTSCGFEVWRPDIRLTLPGEGTVKGHVVDPNGQAVAGVTLVISGGSYNTLRTVSGPDGSFVFKDVLEGHSIIGISRSVQDSQRWVSGRVEVFVKAGQTTAETTLKVSKTGTVDVRVTGSPMASSPTRNPALAQGQSFGFNEPTPPVRASGRVVDLDGKPVTDAVVSIHPFGDHVYTDKEGKFDGLCDKQRADDGGFAVARDTKTGLASVVAVTDWSKSMELRLSPAWTLTGKIADSNGAGIPSARVWLCILAQRCLSELGVEVLTDATGQFQMKAIPPLQPSFEYRLSAVASGYGPREFMRISLSGPAGTSVDIGTIELPTADVSVSGVVVDANGAPAVRVPIFVHRFGGSAQPSKVTATNEKGEFAIRRLCKGAVSFQANFDTSPGGRGLLQAELPTPQDVKIVLGKDLTNPEEIPLLGKPLPSLSEFSSGLSQTPTDGKPILLCLVDLEQRPCRQCLSALAKKAGELSAKGIAPFVIQVSAADMKQYEAWLKDNGIALPIHAASNLDAKRAPWGIKALPWLILADKGHVVRAEGFSVDDLDAVVAKNTTP